MTYGLLPMPLWAMVVLGALAAFDLFALLPGFRTYHVNGEGFSIEGGVCREHVLWANVRLAAARKC